MKVKDFSYVVGGRRLKLFIGNSLVCNVTRFNELSEKYLRAKVILIGTCDQDEVKLLVELSTEPILKELVNLFKGRVVLKSEGGSFLYYDLSLIDEFDLEAEVDGIGCEDNSLIVYLRRLYK